MKRTLISLIALALVHFSTSLMAQIPRVINYQGMLLGSDEQPVAERDYKITFNLYDNSNNLLWSEVHNKVFIGGGMFHVLLGTVNPLNIPFDKPYFLGIQVENEPELQPRMMMTSAAYSLRAEDADKVAGIPVSTTPQPNTLLPLDGSGKFPSSVLSGGAASGDFLRKNAPDTSKGSSSADMLRIENTGSGRGLTVMSANSHGIYGKSASNLAGVEGENSGSGPGTRGFSKNHHGAIGYSEASDKAGVYGNNADGNGVWGNSQNKHGVYGFSNNGRGVKGESAAGGMLGVSTQGFGVEGRSNANDGVVGWSNNPDKSGVFGLSPFGNGVYGRSENKNGIVGVTTSSNPNHAAIRARNEGAGLAIFAEGNVLVSGRTITKVLEITGGADLSELFDVKGSTDTGREASQELVKPGMVVSIDSKNPGKLVVSSQAYDRKVAGIISGAGGVKPGMLMGQSGSVADGQYPVALTGRVYCYVDASNGAIEVGDLLTTSETPGHAMKVTDHTWANGSIIGKAMTPLAEGKGLVLVLVTLQ